MFGANSREHLASTQLPTPNKDTISPDSVIINEKTGNDETIIYVSFKDQKLCQAVASITGSECQGNSVEVSIKQN